MGWTIGIILVSYLIGSISPSYLMGKWVAGIDIRQHGSGNAGATNTMRVLGVKAGIFVFLFDALKGVFMVWIANVLTGGNLVAMVLAGLFTIFGHNWPVYFGFRGGKGVATTIGVLLTLAAVPALCAGVIAIALLLVTRYVSLASLSFVTFVPIFLVLFHRPMMLVFATIFLALVSYWKHRKNIERLAKGQENRLGKKANR
ncbi:glycerol-3-phosphate 1-O-acyltransferase PlsY [Fodinisporobacter ferrooxydans]|uniref:Glycerol-3-phosphate acyltransferase n=1 Tax=Fodinisporobacter ferrooxydans TaxID=2901836 RepID=A0ABY4CGV4_9BACL|nr:glycerol-3-phosphate 1-O-acyltransferase PlsY [Alicyclobacillaceae bacterium MYW30-H2]